MAQRTLEQIQTDLLDRKEQAQSLSALEVLTTQEKQNLNNLNSESKVSIWRLWIYIQAFAIWLHESVFYVFKDEIEELIAKNKVHTRTWYREKALLFQYGYSLFEETDYYNNEGLDEDLVLASKIIKRASVDEVAGRLDIKLAKEDTNATLIPLTDPEITAFSQYMALIKDAGTRLRVSSREADDIKLEINVYYDPLIIDEEGKRIDGTNDTPVITNIQDFLYNLEFNGELILTKLTDSIQTVEGVKFLVIEKAETKVGAFGYSSIGEIYKADAGYMLLDIDETQINYIPRELF